MTARPKHVHACPQCGAEAIRVHRHAGDLVVGLLENVHRYRCTMPECSWEGIVSTGGRTELAGAGVAITWRGRLAWAIVGAAAALAGVAGVQWYRHAETGRAPVSAVQVEAQLLVPVGENFDGVLLENDDPRVVNNPSRLSLRRGCAWGVPGGNPYKGTVTQALSGAKVPDEVVRKIETMIERGIVSDRVEITRDSIRTASGKRRFDTTVTAMAFGKTLCYQTRVNFRPGHVERADLYDATDAKGTNFAVMVPHVCGNVTLLAELSERHNGTSNGHSVPEPATWAIVLAGLAALAASLGVRRRRDEGGADRV